MQLTHNTPPCWIFKNRTVHTSHTVLRPHIYRDSSGRKLNSAREIFQKIKRMVDQTFTHPKLQPRAPISDRATIKRLCTVSNILFSSCAVCLLNLIFFKSNLGWLAHETEPLRTSKKNYSTEFFCHVVSSNRYLTRRKPRAPRWKNLWLNHFVFNASFSVTN